MKRWILVREYGWTGMFVVIKSSDGPEKHYYDKSKKEAERMYRIENGLCGVRMARLSK